MDNNICFWFRLLYFQTDPYIGKVVHGHVKFSSNFCVSFWRSDSGSFNKQLHQTSLLVTDKTAWLLDHCFWQNLLSIFSCHLLKRHRDLMRSNRNIFAIIQQQCVSLQGNDIFFSLSTQWALCSKPCFSFILTSRKVRSRFTT